MTFRRVLLGLGAIFSRRALESDMGALRNMDRPALWIPVSARADIAHVPADWLNDGSALYLFGRLVPGVSRDQAEAIAHQLVISAATWLTARRAALVDPATTLRVE